MKDSQKLLDALPSRWRPWRKPKTSKELKRLREIHRAQHAAKGREYWGKIPVSFRAALIEAHGGFSDKHADQPYEHLTPALQEIANAAAVSPGGIVSLKRLVELGVLNGEAACYRHAPKYPWQRP
jgi:hypothetical protein